MAKTSQGDVAGKKVVFKRKLRNNLWQYNNERNKVYHEKRM